LKVRKTYDYQIKSVIEFSWSWVSTMARSLQFPCSQSSTTS